MRKNNYESMQWLKETAVNLLKSSYICKVHFDTKNMGYNVSVRVCVDFIISFGSVLKNEE